MVLYEPATSEIATAEATKIGTALQITKFLSATKSNNAVVKGDILTVEAKLWWVAEFKTYPLSYKPVTCNGVPAETSLGGIATFSLVAPVTAGSHTITVSFAGDAEYGSSTVSKSYTVEARVPNLTISMPTSGKAGEGITWSGKMTDPKVTTFGIVLKDVYLQQGPSETGPFVNVAGPVKTGADGSYSGIYALPMVPGTYYHRSRFPGGSPGAEHEVAVSKVVAVKVLAPEEVPPKNLDELLWEMFVELLKSLGLPVPPKPLIPLVPPLPLPEGE